MKNKQISDSWDKIEPDHMAQERMLNNILDRVHTTKKGKVSYMRNVKIFGSIAACLVLALAIAIPLINSNDDLISPTPPIVIYENNGGNDPVIPNGTDQTYELIFNNVTGLMASPPVLDRPQSFFHDLTAEQMNAVLPSLGKGLTARAHYFQDGSLIGVGTVGSVGSELHLQIQLAEGEIIQTMLFYEPPEISYVQGIPVTVITSGSDQALFFHADFMLDNVAYRISFIDYRASGQELMTELVNRLISGGAADLSVLNDPVIVEVRNETMSLDQARLDPDFGAFLPENIPPGFNFQSAQRIVDQNTNSLFMLWFSEMNSINWSISEPTENDLARIVSVDDREKFDMSLYSIPLMASVPEELFEYVWNPVFLAEEFSLDVVNARAQSIGEGRMGDGRAGSMGWQMQFSVLFGDVLVAVNTHGPSPEEVWGLFSGLVSGD